MAGKAKVVVVGGGIAGSLLAKSMQGIEFQMGRARLKARGTALKSPTLARPEARRIVPRAGPARWPLSAWAATPARRAGPKHGTKMNQPDSGPITISLLKAFSHPAHLNPLKPYSPTGPSTPVAPSLSHFFLPAAASYSPVPLLPIPLPTPPAAAPSLPRRASVAAPSLPLRTGGCHRMPRGEEPRRPSLLLRRSPPSNLLRAAVAPTSVAGGCTAPRSDTAGSRRRQREGPWGGATPATSGCADLLRQAPCCRAR
ncbi:unnamed protein product [Urochloa humidicola]